MSNFIDYIYINFIYKPFIFIVSYFVHEKYGIFVLIGVIVIFAIFQGKIPTWTKGKYKFLPKVINVFMILMILLLMTVTYFKYKTNIDAFFKTDTNSTKQDSPPTKKNPSSSPTTKTQPTPSQPSVPSSQTQKQLYYAVSCSTCWNEACPRNGYSYGGYDAYWYSYYHGLCKGCECNDFKAQSLWR